MNVSVHGAAVVVSDGFYGSQRFSARFILKIQDNPLYLQPNNGFN